MATATKKKSEGILQKLEKTKKDFNRKVENLKKEVQATKKDNKKGAEVGRTGALRDFEKIPKRASARTKATQSYKKTIKECAKHEELGKKLSR